MSKEIYNMGRVVGYSAYEIYLKHHLSEFPDVPPASETQWLASSLAMGSSMIVKLSGTWTNNTIAIPFPTDCNLAAANAIIASPFLGDVTMLVDEGSNNSWASGVTVYRGVSNTQALHPVDYNVPAGNNTMSAEIKERLFNYTKLHSGVIVQSKQWKESGQSLPYMDLAPDLLADDITYLMLSQTSGLTADVYVMLTGFTDRRILQGIAGLDGSTNTSNPEDGDFLGPGVFPWAAPVIFTVPTECLAAGLLSGTYARQLPTTATSQQVSGQPFIDMVNTDPNAWYLTNYPESQVDLNITDLQLGAHSDADVLTVYDRGVSPALYGGKYMTTGAAKMAPLDNHAPNSVHMLSGYGAPNADTRELAKKYLDIPHNRVLYMNTENNALWSLTLNGDTVESNYIAQVRYYPTNAATPTYAHVYAGKHEVHALAMADKNNVNYNLSGSSGTIPLKFKRSALSTGYLYAADISWENIINSLHTNKALQLALTVFKENPDDTDYIDVTSIVSHMITGTYIGAACRRGDKYIGISLRPGYNTGQIDEQYGSFHAVLKLNKSEYSSAASMSLRLLAYLDEDVSIRYIHGVDTVGQNLFNGAGFYYRYNSLSEVIPDVSSGGSVDFPSSNTRALFAAAPGHNYNAGAPNVLAWTNMTEADSEKYSKLLGQTFTFSSILNNWGINTELTCNRVAGSNNDEARLIDRSYAYDDSIGLNTIRGNMSTAAGHWTARSASGLKPEELYNNASFYAQLNGVFYDIPEV